METWSGERIGEDVGAMVMAMAMVPAHILAELSLPCIYSCREFP